MPRNPLRHGSPCPAHPTICSPSSKGYTRTSTPIPNCRCRSAAPPASPRAWLRQQGYEVTEGVGGTGVVGLLRNGDGATVMLRADMDALPIEESTGLPYASKADRHRPLRPGHRDRACLRPRHARGLADGRDRASWPRTADAWRGTVMAVFQPGEETAQGARAMIEDGMVKRFPKPDVTLGQHVMPLSAGQIGWRTGTMLSAGDSLEVTLFGRGAHGSMPQKSIDPVVMAAAAVHAPADGGVARGRA